MLWVSQGRMVEVEGEMHNGHSQRYFFGMERYSITVSDRNDLLKYVQRSQQCYQNWHKRFLRMEN